MKITNKFSIGYIVAFSFFVPLNFANSADYSCSGSRSALTISPGQSIASAINNAQNGEVIALQSGTYNESKIMTKKDNITICSAVKHGAVIVNDTGSETIGINSNNVTIKGLHLTSNNSSGAGGSLGMVRFYSSVGGVIDSNIVEKARTGQISIGGSRPGDKISNVKITNNILRDSGLGKAEGEAIYVGSVQDAGSYTVTNVLISGNIIENFTANAIDVKKVGSQIEIHHNIFKNHLQTQDPNHQVGGTLVLSGKNISVHDNIILNAANASTWGIFAVAEYGNNEVFNNVAIGSGPNASVYIRSRSRGQSGASSVVHDNIACNLSSYKINVSAGVIARDNINNPALSVCEDRQAEIEYEMNIFSEDTPVSNPSPEPNPPNIVCHTIFSPMSVIAGFGLPYDTVSNTTLLQALCSDRSDYAIVTAGVENGALTAFTYVWSVGYHWSGSAWTKINYICDAQQVGGWCLRSANAVITRHKKSNGGDYIIAYTCVWNGSRWRCGCKDNACETPSWQLQFIK